jgi:hypothetical protein
MCPPFLGSEGYWEKATCSIKSGQPLSEKGDFELAVDLAGLRLSTEPTFIQ